MPVPDPVPVVTGAGGVSGAFNDATLVALFGSMPSGVAYLRMEVDADAEVDFTLLHVNPAFYTLIGMPLEVGSRWSAWPGTGALHDHSLRRLLARVVQENSPQTFEKFLPTLNKWFSACAYSPNPGHLMLVFSDISNSRNAQDSLRISEQQQRALIEASPVPFALYDTSGNIVYLNAAFVNTYGYTLADIPHLDQWWLKAYPDPDYREWAKSTWQNRRQQSLRDGTSFERFEVNVHCKDGRQRIVLAGMAHLGSALGDAHLVVLYDITFHRNARQAVADAQAYAELILESMGEGLCQLDEEGRITFMSPAGAHLLGYQPEEMIGRNAQALFHHSAPDGRPYPAESCASWFALRDGVHCARDTEVYWRKDGSSFPVHYVSSPMVVGGIQHGAVVTFRDISEETRVRRALQDNETKLHQVNETLESRVQERTQALAAALETAEMAKRSRGQFLANMSHEIRTPMNSVMGMVYLALKTDPNPVQRDYLEKIQKSGAHLLSIINDILDFSKIDAGKLELESGIFDLEQVLQHIVNVAGDKTSEKGLGLRLEVGPDVPKLLRGDALRVGQILINFLNNAIKFTAQGGVVIRVHLLPLAQPLDAGTPDLCQLSFEVEDTGIGIDESQCARLFESFEQGDPSTTRKYGGTGLGLAISRQLAILMGGEIGVSSRLGVGSTFWFIAHFHQAHDARQLVRPPTSVQDAIASLRGKHVLVADDNEFNLDVARGLLQDIGVRVATAENGSLAVDAIRSTAFDCVLMDMQMPVMDGLLATRTIRGDPAIAHMVVIAMTANAGQEDLNRCLQAGMDEVLTKPIDPDLLFMTLAKWLHEPYQHSEAPKMQSTTTTPTMPKTPTDPTVKPEHADVSALPVWDASALTRIVGDNPAAHVRLLDKYLLTAKETVASIRSSADGGQWIAVADQAHKLKSSSRSVGAMQLGALCESLEHAGRGNKADLCEALVQSVTQHYAQVQARIAEQRMAT